MAGLALRFERGRDGGVITRLPSGKVALISRRHPCPTPPPQAGEEWEVEVVTEKERVAFVRPLRRVEKRSEGIWELAPQAEALLQSLPVPTEGDWMEGKVKPIRVNLPFRRTIVVWSGEVVVREEREQKALPRWVWWEIDGDACVLRVAERVGVLGVRVRKEPAPQGNPDAVKFEVDRERGEVRFQFARQRVTARWGDGYVEFTPSSVSTFLLPAVRKRAEELMERLVAEQCEAERAARRERIRKLRNKIRHLIPALKAAEEEVAGLKKQAALAREYEFSCTRCGKPFRVRDFIYTARADYTHERGVVKINTCPACGQEIKLLRKSVTRWTSVGYFDEQTPVLSDGWTHLSDRRVETYVYEPVSGAVEIEAPDEDEIRRAESKVYSLLQQAGVSLLEWDEIKALEEE